jgi:hypothetical protein
VGTDVLTATLTGSDITTFGENAQGRGGFSWVPIETTSMIDEVTPLISPVASVYIRDNAILRCGSLVTAGNGISGPTTSTDTFRLRHGVVRGNDFSALGAVSGTGDITAFTGSEFAGRVERYGNRLRDGKSDTHLTRCLSLRSSSMS